MYNMYVFKKNVYKYVFIRYLDSITRINHTQCGNRTRDLLRSRRVFPPIQIGRQILSQTTDETISDNFEILLILNFQRFRNLQMTQ
jgi:hypothetical protein